jgi:hypothetical protein
VQQALRGGAYCEGGRKEFFLMRHMVLYPVHTCDNMHEEVEALWATKSPENVFHQVADVVEPTVVHTKGNLNIFSRHLQCICSTHCKCEMITITNVAMRRVYRYGRGIRRVLNVRQTQPKR